MGGGKAAEKPEACYSSQEAAGHRQNIDEKEGASLHRAPPNKSDVLLGHHVDDAAGGEPQGRDHGQGHEAEGHEGIDAPAYAQSKGCFLGILQIPVHILQGVLTDDAGDGKDNLCFYLALGP